MLYCKLCAEFKETHLHLSTFTITGDVFLSYTVTNTLILHQLELLLHLFDIYSFHP